MKQAAPNCVHACDARPPRQWSLGVDGPSSGTEGSGKAGAGARAEDNEDRALRGIPLKLRHYARYSEPGSGGGEGEQAAGQSRALSRTVARIVKCGSIGFRGRQSTSGVPGGAVG